MIENLQVAVPEDDVKLAAALEELANQTSWNPDVWTECFHLAMESSSELANYVFNDIMHYSGRSLFGRAPKPEHFRRYVNKFRAVAFGLRRGFTLSDLKSSGQME